MEGRAYSNSSPRFTVAIRSGARKGVARRGWRFGSRVIRVLFGAIFRFISSLNELHCVLERLHGLRLGGSLP